MDEFDQKNELRFDLDYYKYHIKSQSKGFILGDFES